MQKMKTFILLAIMASFINHSQAQILKKMKDKATQIVNKAEDKALGGNGEGNTGQSSGENAEGKNTGSLPASSNSPKDLKSPLIEITDSFLSMAKVSFFIFLC